ncbi:MAG: sodium:calcium antiporter [Arenimonas sp.]
MLLSTGLFFCGLLVLLLGGDSAVKGIAGMSQRLGLSGFKTGVLMMLFATSVPELAVNAYAIFSGHPEIALGNAVGSNIVNIGLTLALAAISAPMLLGMRSLALQIVFLLVATGMVLLLGLDGGLQRWEGGLLVITFVAAVFVIMQRASAESAETQKEVAEVFETSTSSTMNVIRILIGSALLFFGAKLVIEAAPVIGFSLGFGPLLTGLTIVAIGTALPEVVMAILAARSGKANLVAGLVVGACLFNLLFLVGCMAIVNPVVIPASFIGFELPAAMAFTLALYPILGGDLRISRNEGFILFLLFLCWLAFELFKVWA